MEFLVGNAGFVAYYDRNGKTNYPHPARKAMTTACIFNIQKFSLHDGPGIRTTVFFKGCPLRCLWCANPESLLPGVQVMWNGGKCVRCGACAAACSSGAVVASGDGVAVDHALCIGCGACVEACAVGALALSGKEYTVDEVVKECLADREFYEESGGGVTLSGGEVTMQAGFVLELLGRLREEKIHTALETNGFAAPEVFSRLAGAADLLLFDVKHYDAEAHRKGTGVDPERILANLAAALAAGREVLVRIPVIRGYSDSLNDAAGFARLLTGMGVERAQLLPFHQMGQNKYEMLGMEYFLGDQAQMRKEDLAEYRQVMMREGMREVIV